MKKTIALLLVAMLLGIGLIVSCSDDAEETKDDDKTVTPTTPLAKYKVIFDSDGRVFTDGTTAIKVVDVEENATVGSKWPEIDEENIGTDTLQGWYDGDTQVTRSTKITKDLILKAKYEAALFTIDTNLRTAIHTNFVIAVSASGKHGSWDFTPPDGATYTNNNKEEGGNKFIITNGGIQYRFPVTVNFDYKDYDFIDVEYTASGVNSLLYKQYDSAADYALTGSGISNTGDDEKKVITWEVRNAVATDAGGIGFAIQKYQAGTADTTIQFTKITFKQTLRYTVKFDTNGGSALPDTYLVDGTKIGDHLPVNTTKAGKIFAGWLYKSAVGSHAEGDPVAAADIVDSNYNGITFKAYWLDQATVPKITVDFSDLTKMKAYAGDGATGNNAGDPVVSALTGADAGKGYAVTGLYYEHKFVTFPITITSGATLAHYNTVSFELEGNDWKNVVLIAAPASGDDAFDSSLINGDYVRTTKAIAPEFVSRSDTKFTVTINKPKASSLKGDIEFAIVYQGTTTPTYKFKNIVFE